MDNPNRLRRKDPIRKGPIRNPSTYFRDSKSWKEQETQTGQTQSERPGPSDSMDDVVTHGVKLGYEVIEKYLLQGQKVAEEIRNGSHPGHSNEEDWEKLVGNMLRLYRDMSGFWIDAVEVIMRSPDFLSNFMGVIGSNGHAESPRTEKNANQTVNGKNMKVAVEIVSKRRAQVTLDLRPHPVQGILHVHSLHAPDPHIPPLTNVAFRIDSDVPGPVLALNIPDEQPAATYTGVVVEQKTNEARGTICVRLLP